ncbi:MAG: hypothetical protein ACLRPT_08870 [Akkermansia muciniphila]
MVSDKTSDEVFLDVLNMLEEEAHVVPRIMISSELRSVTEDYAPGIKRYRNNINKMLPGRQHFELMSRTINSLIEDAARQFNVLVIKTKTSLPYSNIYIELDSGYWNSESETVLRKFWKPGTPPTAARPGQSAGRAPGSGSRARATGRQGEPAIAGNSRLAHGQPAGAPAGKPPTGFPLRRQGPRRASASHQGSSGRENRHCQIFMNHHMDKATEERLRAEAWVGDAILALYVREWILAEEGAINGKLFVEFTSNDFLRRTGNATGVEAEIGRTFKAGGLEAAYAWIEHHLRPRMEERWHTLRRKVLR